MSRCPYRDGGRGFMMVALMPLHPDIITISLVTPHLSSHPLVLDRLARLRERDTPPPVFRWLVHDLSVLLFLEASRDLRTEEVTIQTPLASCPGQKVADGIGLFPILRAGLGMAQAILNLVPEAQVWHLG